MLHAMIDVLDIYVEWNKALALLVEPCVYYLDLASVYAESDGHSVFPDGHT